jgi:hypothetical protein
MDYLLSIAIVIVVVILTFMLLIFMPRPKVYFEPSETYPELTIFLDNEYRENIVKEVEDLFKSGNIKNHLDDRCRYKILYDENTLESMEILHEVLMSIPCVKRAFIAEVKEKTELPQNKGSASTANATLRCLIPINIPAIKKSGIWGDGEKKFFFEDQILIYDHSRSHYIFNNHKYKKLLLLVIDIDRPESIPMGIAIDDNDYVL